MTRSSLYMQQKHYLGAIEPHLSCHAICRLLPYPTHASTAVVCNLCMTILFTWPTPTDEFGLIDWLTTVDAFSRAIACGWLAACLWSHAPYVSLAVSESVWSKNLQERAVQLCTAWCHRKAYMHSQQGSRVNNETIRARERNVLQILTQNWPFKSRNCTYLVIITAVTQNHDNCRKLRYKAKITAIVNSWFIYIPNHAAFY